MHICLSDEEIAKQYRTEGLAGAHDQLVQPFPHATSQPVRSKPMPSTWLTGCETILLVDDEPDVRRVTATLLKKQGYTVLEAGDGDQALALCAQAACSIHLLITDLDLPGMTGLELVQHVTASYPGIKALCISGSLAQAVFDGHGDEPNNAECLESGLAFLQKPYTPGALARRVRQVLDGVT